MNLDKLFAWVMGVVLVFAAAGRLDVLQNWIWRAQARVVYESRTSTWGSPRFFPPDNRSFGREIGAKQNDY
jgi:hypothetical protein